MPFDYRKVHKIDSLKSTRFILGVSMICILSRILIFVAIFLSISDIARSSICGDLFSESEILPLEEALDTDSTNIAGEWMRLMLTSKRSADQKLQVLKQLEGRIISGKYLTYVKSRKAERVSKVNGAVIDVSPKPGHAEGEAYLLTVANRKAPEGKEYTISLDEYPNFSELNILIPKVRLDLSSSPGDRAKDISNWIAEVIATEDTIHGTTHSLSQLVGHRVSGHYYRPGEVEVTPFNGDVRRIGHAMEYQSVVYQMEILTIPEKEVYVVKFDQHRGSVLRILLWLRYE